MGCSSGDDEQRPQTEPKGPPAVRFEGGSLPGKIYIAAGPDELNADVYRVQGTLSDARRLTWGGRVSALTAWGGEVVVADARRSGSDRLESLDLRAPDALPGRVIDPRGQAPELSRSGRLTWSVPLYGSEGQNAGTRVYVADARGGGRRIAYQSPRDLTSGWGPDGRLAVLVGHPQKLVLDPGTPRETALDLGLESTLNFQTASDGTLWALGRGAVVIVSPSGASRRLRANWLPITWSPDGRSILVVRGARLGLLSPGDGSVREIGTVQNGVLLTADWIGSE